MKILMFLSMLLVVTSTVWAYEMPVCRITSNTDSEVTDYSVEINDGKIVSMRLYRTLHNRVLSDDTYTVEDVMDGGVVTIRREGREIVRLKVENFTPENGGIIIQDYLYNGLNNSRGYHRSKFIKIGDDFAYQDMNGNKVNRMFYFGRWIFGKLVGISTVRTSYDPDGL